MDRNVNIIVGLNGEKIILINTIRFMGRKREDWKKVKNMSGNFTRLQRRSRKYSFPAVSRMSMPVQTVGLFRDAGAP